MSPRDLKAAPRARRIVIVLSVAAAGLLMGFAAPAHPVAWAWTLAYAPLFVALDLSLRGVVHPGRCHWRRWGRVLACTWPVGVLLAVVSGDWVEQAAYVFGGFPKPLSYAASWFGYGSLIGCEVFFTIGVPFALALRRPLFQLALVTLWPTVLQAYLPRFLFWSYGNWMITAPPLVQIADLVGSAGLNFWILPLYWLIYACARSLYDPGWLPRRDLIVLAGALAVLFGSSALYGLWRMEQVAAAQAQGAPLRLVGVQPNFSFKRLASHPERVPSDRLGSLALLLSDSDQALARGSAAGDRPTVVVWPESAYPGPYFYDRQSRQMVEQWVRERDLHLVVESIDTRQPFPPPADGRQLIYGAAMHVSPAGTDPVVYHKLTPIPFGETVPLGETFPWWRDFYHRLVQNTSDFEAGHEFTVFDVAPGVQVAPLICFDAFDDDPALGMADRGATLGLLMANLTWFGHSTAARQMQFFLRFRAIENRIPILMLSLNGESVLIDARGELASERLGLFEVGALSLEIHAGPGGSFFTRHSRWIHRLYALALVVLLLEYARWVIRASRRPPVQE